MGRRSRKSKRKINSLFLTMLLTAVLLIMSTYAWFSANKQVQINLFRAKVSAAEGLQISLDGQTWGSSVDVSPSILADLAKPVASGGFGTGESGIHYQFPEELVPVSADGTITGADMNFRYGDISSDGSTLTDTDAVSATGGGKFIAFDCYFKNSSSQATDKFQLDANSAITIGTDDTNTASVDETGVQNTGLEYSVRAGVMLYGATAAMTADGATVRALTPASGDTTPIPAKAFIWEPSCKSHINEVVLNDDRIAAANTQFHTLALNSTASGTVTGVNASTVGTNTSLTEQPSVQTEGTSISSAMTMTSTEATPTDLELKGNAIMKTRIYIWLEGQDPDCNDTASTGKYINVLLKFTKPSVTNNSGGGSGGGTGG